jgi:hypothetical protein
MPMRPFKSAGLPCHDGPDSHLNLTDPMYLVAIAWLYVVLMMSLAEALSTQGTVLGAVITFVLYGVLPLSLVMYVMGTPHRRRARLAAQARAQTESTQPDGSGHAPGAAVTPERKEP